MTTAAPWSVKGVDPRARDAAKDLARREGLSLGEWFNRVIGELEAEDADAWEPPPAPIRRPAAPSTRARNATGEIESVARLIEQLNRRLDASDQRSTLAITGIDQSVLGLATRVDSAERATAAAVGRVDATLEELRALHGAVAERVRKIETDDAPGKALAAMRALEGALSKLAAHVYASEERSKAALAGVQDQIEATSGRIDAALAESGRRMEQAIAASELRAQGAAEQAAQRLERVERNLVGAVDSAQVHARSLADRLDRTERDIRGFIEDAQSRLERAEREQADTAKALQDHLVQLDQRLKGAESIDFLGAAQKLTSRLDDGLAEIRADMNRAIAAARAEMARDAVGVTGDAADVRFQRLMTDVSQRLDAAERRQADALERMGMEVARVADGLDRKMRGLSGADLGSAVDVRDEIARLSRAIDERLGAVERREAQAIGAVAEQVARLSERVETRVSESERRSAAALEQVGDTVARAVERVQARGDAAIRDLVERIGRVEASGPAAPPSGDDSRVLAAVDGLAARFGAFETATRETLDDLSGRVAGLERPAKTGPTIEDAFQAATAPEALLAAAPAAARDAPKPAATAAGPLSEDPFALEPFAAAPDPGPDSMLLATGPDPSEPLTTGPAFEVSQGDAAGDWSQNGPGADAADPFAPVAAPPRRDDYLSQARRAAQAAAELEAVRQAKGKKGARSARGASPRGKAAPPLPPRTLILAGVVGAVIVAGAAFVLINRMGQPPAPVAVPPPAAVEAPAPALVEPATEPDLRPTLEVEPVEGLPEEAAAPPPAEAAANPRPVTPPAQRAETRTAPVAASPPRQLAAAAAAPPAARPAPAPAAAAPRPAGAAPAAAPARAAAEPAATDGQATFRQAQAALQAGDRSQAARLMQRAAEQGVPAAQYRLAQMYERGEGVSQDMSQARRWTERAAESGNAQARHNLGVFYARGEGGEQNLERAAENFRQAARAGVADSQYNLAAMLEEGAGVQANPREALYWYREAAKNGDGDAAERVRALSAQVEPAGEPAGR